MKKKKNYSNDILEYILTIATIVNIMIIAKVLGIQGIGYFAVTITFAYVLIAVTSGWASGFITKYIKGRNVRKQYKNASNFFKGSMITVGISNFIIAAVVLIFSSQIGNYLLKDIHFRLCIIAAAPIIFVYAICSVFCGYYKGLGMNRPVRIYSMIRLFVTLAGSIYFMEIAMKYGKKVAALLQSEKITYIYGAFGAILGFLAGYVVGLIVLFVFWILLHGEVARLANSDATKYFESVGDCARTVFVKGLISGVKNFLFLAAPLVNYILYLSFSKSTGADEGITLGGCLFGIAIPCMLCIVVIFMLANHKGYKGLSSMIRNEDFAQVKNQLFNMLLGVCSFGLFLTATLAVLSPILGQAVLKTLSEKQSNFIMCVIMCAIFVIVEIILVRFQMLQNNHVFVYICGAVGFLLQILSFVVSYKIFQFGSYSIVLGVAVNCIAILVLSALKMRKRIRFQSVYIRYLVMAGIVALASALLILLAYQLLEKVLSGIALFVICLIPGLVLYLLGMVFLQIIDYDEVEQIPFGGMVLQVARLLHRE